jgi:hypothetical protein
MPHHCCGAVGLGTLVVVMTARVCEQQSESFLCNFVRCETVLRLYLRVDLSFFVHTPVSTLTRTMS